MAHPYRSEASATAKAKQSRLFSTGGGVCSGGGEGSSNKAAGSSSAGKFATGGAVEGEKPKKRLDKPARGKKFEGSPKDKKEDAALANKHGMTKAAWEKSPLDDKHDAQKGPEGLKCGGVADNRPHRATGGRVKGKNSKTNINIIIGADKGGDQQPQAVPIPVPVGGGGGAPVARPPMQMPAQGGAPAAGPTVVPVAVGGAGGAPAGAGVPPQGLPMRKRGGRVEAGAMSGQGRLNKAADAKR